MSFQTREKNRRRRKQHREQHQQTESLIHIVDTLCEKPPKSTEPIYPTHYSAIHNSKRITGTHSIFYSISFYFHNSCHININKSYENTSSSVPLLIFILLFYLALYLNKISRKVRCFLLFAFVIHNKTISISLAVVEIYG